MNIYPPNIISLISEQKILEVKTVQKYISVHENIVIREKPTKKVICSEINFKEDLLVNVTVKILTR